MDYNDVLKLYILVRKDIDVSIGKLMVHVGHICSNLIYRKLGKMSYFVYTWMQNDHPIIILSVKSLIQMDNYIKKWNISRQNRPTIVIPDAGYYEVPEGTVLMCGLGLMRQEEAKELGLKRLQLYKG